MQQHLLLGPNFEKINFRFKFFCLRERYLSRLEGSNPPPPLRMTIHAKVI